MDAANDEKSMLTMPTELSQRTLLAVLKQIFGTTDFRYTIVAGSAKGDNYIGIIYRVTAKANAKDCAQRSIIVKLPPQSAARRTQFLTTDCFEREAYFYDEIVPVFMKFQQSKGVEPKESGFYEVPFCYQTNRIVNDEAIFLEDLREKHFLMFDRSQEITYEHARHVMLILGKFHAISFAIKDQDPKLFEPFKKLTDLFSSRNTEKGFNDWLTGVADRARTLIDPIKDAHLLERFNKKIDLPYLEVLAKCMDPKLTEPYAVINHGDCWTNNILFRYENDLPIEARFLDWQIIRYTTPVCDLLYFMFGCVTKAVRNKYYEILMNDYYDSLSQTITRLGSDPVQLFPYSAFREHLLTFGHFGLLMAMIVLPIFTSDADDVPNLDELAEKLNSGQAFENLQFASAKTDSVYRERMRGVIEDMLEMNYI